MLGKFNLLLLFLLTCFYARTQLYLPLVNYYNDEAQRYELKDTNSLNLFQSHQSFKPILDLRTNTDSLYFNSEKHYYWITQKIFKKNFLIFKGDDFWVSIDPILDLELGTDFSADSTERLYWNTRGIRIQGKLLGKVGFTTSIYENQALLPSYQSLYVDGRGEFFPNSLNTKYTQNNAVIPGYGRTKPFKNTGYDFAFAQGNISYVPNKHINFQIGNGNHFIGAGYRSLLLADYTTNYPFAKIETNFWKGRIQYSAMYAMHQNLYRLHAYSTPEATYEKKIGTYHYLDFAVNKKLQIALFEGSLWRRVDSLGSHTPHPLFLNPLPFNTAVKGFEASGYKSIFGFNFSAHLFWKTLLYGQLIFDQAKIGGFQFGLKAYDLLIPKLDFLIEYNRVELNTYLSEDKRYNYGHFNLPLAHPYVNGFQELVIRLSYTGDHLFIQNNMNYSQRLSNDSLDIGNDILLASSQLVSVNHTIRPIVYNQFEIGYRFNKTNNLSAFIGHLYRNESHTQDNPLTNYTYIGVRTRLKNKYTDY